MDNKAFAKAILMDCPNTFSYFQSLPEHPLFLSAVAKAYHEQWFREFERFLILQGYTCSGKSTFLKFLRLVSGETEYMDMALSEFQKAITEQDPYFTLTGNPNRKLYSNPKPKQIKSINLLVDAPIIDDTTDIIKAYCHGTYRRSGRYYEYPDTLQNPPLIILTTQIKLTRIDSSGGLERRQLLLNFQPIASPIHNYLEHQQISYEIPAFLNCLAGMSKDDCLQILATTNRSQLTAK